jgi:hypothetical protein
MADPSLLSLLLTGGIGLGGTWLGAYLNRKAAIATAHQLLEVERHKYAQSRLWDAKKDAYTEIVAHLNGVHKDVQYTLDRLFDPDIDPQPYIESKEFNDDATEHWRRISALNATLDNSSLIASEEFKSAFEQWRVDFIAYDIDDDPRRVATVQSDAMNKHKPALIRLAKDELVAAPKRIN